MSNLTFDAAGLEPEYSMDYAERILSDPDTRGAEIRELSWHTKVTSVRRSDADTATLQYGVSVIVPSHHGVGHIARCVRSLLNQDLMPQRFEIVVIINGVDDGTSSLLRKMRNEFPQHNLRIFFQTLPGAGRARNVGISAANYSHVTFVDDDDYVGPTFLSSMLNVAEKNRIGVAPIINVFPDGSIDENNSLNLTIAAKYGGTFDLFSASDLVGFNACKLFPTASLSSIRYEENLRSGEDICFMAEAAVNNRYWAKVGSTESTSAYFRSLRDNSVSRRTPDFDFAVSQRLAVIERLENLQTSDKDSSYQLISALIESQAGFIKRYLEINGERRVDVVEAINASAVKFFPWSMINKDLARDLVVSYCYAPYADTSATVAAKAIVERGRIVDVLYNNMSKVRGIDSSLETIASQFVDQTIEIDAPPSFADWKNISAFVSKGIALAEIEDSRKGGYRTIYSRVLWPGSHFLAALFKIRHPLVRWTAEFSDPLSHDAKGMPRAGSVERDSLFRLYSRSIRSAGHSVPKTDSLFAWCEHITYVLADEIIFTNENQLVYMLSNIGSEKLRREIRAKSIVRPHPTPPQRSYEVVQSKYHLSKSVVNIGYFGGFYENRGLTDVLIGLMNSSQEVRGRMQLHVFTNNAVALEEFVVRNGLVGQVKILNYVPYLEFLNLSTKFDVLLVNDVERDANLSINPFLPSKYSDYLGSGRPIWGVVDQGSPLSNKEIQYVSSVGDSARAVTVLQKIYADWISSNRAPVTR